MKILKKTTFNIMVNCAKITKRVDVLKKCIIGTIWATFQSIMLALSSYPQTGHTAAQVIHLKHQI